MENKELMFYYKNKPRYEKAVPKLRKMIKELEDVKNSKGDALTPNGERKLIALIHELGRIQGILAVLNSDIVEPEIKITYADIIIDMIKSPNPMLFMNNWHKLNVLDTIFKKKGLRTIIWVGSEKIGKN